MRLDFQSATTITRWLKAQLSTSKHNLLGHQHSPFNNLLLLFGNNSRSPKAGNPKDNPELGSSLTVCSIEGTYKALWSAKISQNVRNSRASSLPAMKYLHTHVDDFCIWKTFKEAEIFKSILQVRHWVAPKPSWQPTIFLHLENSVS